MSLTNQVHWEITTKKQENGLFGMPLQCVKIDKIFYTSEENLIKHSAICIGIAEAYPTENFEIFWSDESGFYIKLSESGMKRIRYENYKIEGNSIIWVD